MLELFQLPPLAMALAIFLLRVCDMTLDTLRVLFIVRGNRPVVWFLGFFQSTIWVVAITSAAGTPLSVTSATITISRPSGSGMKS